MGDDLKVSLYGTAIMIWEDDPDAASGASNGSQLVKVRFYRRWRLCRSAICIGSTALPLREAFREAIQRLFSPSGELFREQVGIHYR